MPRVESIEHVEASVRVISQWAPATVRAALQQAQQGNFANVGALADAVLGDDRAQAVLGTRVNGLLSIELDFKPALEGHERSLAAAEALEEDWWEFAPEQTLIEWLTYGLLAGACAAELVWDVSGPRALPRLKVWHPSLLKRDEKGVWSVEAAGGTVPVTPGDGKWALLLPYGRRVNRALIRPLSLAFLSKAYALTDWNRMSEVYGTPVRVGTVPAAATSAEKEAFHADLRKLASDATITMPEGWSLSLIEAKAGVGTGEIFEKLIKWADKAMAIAALGQNLTTDVEGGSHAAAQVHENVRNDLIGSDAEVLSTTLRDQVVVWWSEFNFGARDLAPWPEWDTSPPADEEKLASALKSRSEALLALSQAAQATGLQVDWTAIAEEQNIPVLEVEVAAPPPPMQVRLASGDPVGSARSFVAGQLYADELVDASERRAAAAMAPALERVLELVRGARSYEELRSQLLVEFAGLPIGELRDLTESSVTLAMLAGRLAVIGDDG